MSARMPQYPRQNFNPINYRFLRSLCIEKLEKESVGLGDVNIEVDILYMYQFSVHDRNFVFILDNSIPDITLRAPETS